MAPKAHTVLQLVPNFVLSLKTLRIRVLQGKYYQLCRLLIFFNDVLHCMLLTSRIFVSLMLFRRHYLKFRNNILTVTIKSK